MKASSKVGLLAAVALLAITAVATSAQAASFNPDSTAVSGSSGNSAFSYGVAFVDCDTARADGSTGLDSDRITDIALTFTDNCAVAGVGPATVDCVGTVTLIANPAADDTVTIVLPEGFECVVTTAVCTITVAGPQTPPQNAWLDEANDFLRVELELHANRAGSVLCGPDAGDAIFTADYATSPSNLTIDP